MILLFCILVFIIDITILYLSDIIIMYLSDIISYYYFVFYYFYLLFLFFFFFRQETMLRVLKASSVRNPEIGYCQGMGFVTALLLMYNEEEVKKKK